MRTTAPKGTASFSNVAAIRYRWPAGVLPPVPGPVLPEFTKLNVNTSVIAENTGVMVSRTYRRSAEMTAMALFVTPSDSTVMTG